MVSTLPDSGSRTCIGPLFAPDGTSVRPSIITSSGSPGNSSGKYTHYMVGNQIDKGRDPVTLSLARDGLVWDRQWAVRYGAPAVRYPGHAKGKGFQYPGAYIDTDTNEMLVTYSIGKEDIGLTRFSLAELELL